MRILRPMLPLLLVLAGVYAAVCLVMYVVQERLVYFPSRTPPGAPPGPGASEVELVTSDGVRLHAWLFEPPRPRGALVFCHGNGGNIAGRLFDARAFQEMGLTVLLFDYRGYGSSEGSPTEKGTYLDAEAAWERLAALGFPPDRIAAYGESLGGAVAIELARRRPLAGLVVEAAFTSIPDIGATAYPWLPVRLLARVRYDNARKLPGLEVPLLLVHSRGDEIVPFEHAERLLALAPPTTELLVTEGGHNEGGFLRRRAWIERVRDFLLAALSTS